LQFLFRLFSKTGTIIVKSLATKDELNDQRVTPKGKSPNEILAAGG